MMKLKIFENDNNTGTGDCLGNSSSDSMFDNSNGLDFKFTSIRSIFDLVIHYVRSNPLLARALILLLSSTFGFLAFYWQMIRDKIKNVWMCQVQIKNTDNNFDSVLEYLTKQLKDQNKSCQSMLVITKVKKGGKTYKERLADWYGTGAKKADTFDLRPGDESNISSFTFGEKKKMIWVYRQRKAGNMQVINNRPYLEECITFFVWGKDNSVILKFLDAALEASFLKDEDGLKIYVQCSSSWRGGWEKAVTKSPRALESVIMDVDIADELIKDAKLFLTRAKWYMNLGIPYRRGYLLYGPPGCGKTR